MQRPTDRRVYASIFEDDAQDRAINILKPADGQSDGTPTPGVKHQIPKSHDTVPLPLPCLTGVLSDLEQAPK